MNKLLILILISIPLTGLAAADFKGCGVYSMHGRLIKNEKDQLVYLVHGGTRSQLDFAVNGDDVATFAAYLDKPTSIEAVIPKPMEGTKGSIKKISKINIRLPDPLNPEHDSFISLKSKKDCEK
ncbi:hypothetical protein [Peredibacter starrii]|uniref:Uncharacterized protein n=1 Tax=Peredibacter starrii TaxID=28202 RepID=A0AAX4HR46_9BACT|nr:hypothetical protein [Peredibacter starrii]WPU65660.1 hypothetical protein SOO65_02775 [Peredibacter starrii]